MIGQSFGNWKAISLLGEGGMGAVYLAEHPDIGRKVAVKVLRQELARDEQLLLRFMNEARAANAIRHPNIIEILDTGTTAAGTPFLVMELLEGESLAARLRRVRRLSAAEALAIAEQTASALAAAHRKGIVHRDLKPDNLFLLPPEGEGGRERVKVLDFGIAKLQATRPGDQVKTRTGTLMGTPVYMSPEQCLGTRDVDARTDIYALGVILYEMVCGEPPFFSTGFGELVHLHLNVPPRPPRALAPEVPEPLEALILRALAKRPEDRFATMAELQEALRAGGSAAARAPTPAAGHTMPLPTPVGNVRPETTLSTAAGEITARVQPRRRLLAPLAVAGLVLAGGFAVYRATRRPPRPAAAPSPQPVRIRFESVPAGARVVGPDGRVLGTTPFEAPFPAGPPIELRFEREGHEPVTRAVPLDRDARESVVLPARAPAPVVQPPPVEPKRPKKPAPPRPRPREEEPAKL